MDIPIFRRSSKSAGTSSTRGLKKVDLGGRPSRAVADDPLEIVRISATPTRLQILKLLQQGFDHPEDLAAKLKVRRQAIDKHLVELFDWGLVDRAAVFPPTGRPRIVYQMTQRGKDLVDVLEQAANQYRVSFRGDFDRELEALEARLAAGEIAEEMYFKRRKELEARYQWVVRPGID